MFLSLIQGISQRILRPGRALWLLGNKLVSPWGARAGPSLLSLVSPVQVGPLGLARGWGKGGSEIF